MGQHKANPTAIAAKNGEIPPKKRVIIDKREREDYLRQKIFSATKANIEKERQNDKH